MQADFLCGRREHPSTASFIAEQKGVTGVGGGGSPIASNWL